MRWRQSTTSVRGLVSRASNVGEVFAGHDDDHVLGIQELPTGVGAP